MTPSSPADRPADPLDAARAGAVRLFAGDSAASGVVYDLRLLGGSWRLHPFVAFYRRGADALMLGHYASDADAAAALRAIGR